MATVSLKDLSGHLGDAAKLCDRAMQSKDEEPELDFGALRKSLRSALELLGEENNGAADSARVQRGARGKDTYDFRYKLSDIFDTHRHPYRNHRREDA
jgi:hypothetical protein